MPRIARKQSVFGIYHVMMRGINRQNIFDEDADYFHFIDILQELPLLRAADGSILPGHTCSIYAWCLMSNHFHLLVREGEYTIGEVVKSLASSYVFYYNKKNERVGHLFQDRFKSEACNDMAYFITLVRYIHQNPVKAGIVDNAENYRWSSWNMEYLHPSFLRQSVCNTSAVLKKIPLSDLRSLVNEPCNTLCVDMEYSGKRLTDSQVGCVLESICGVRSVSDFQSLSPEVQMKTIVEAKQSGASIRQLVSHTGLTFGQIRKCGWKENSSNEIGTH
jgi:putative transposase